jgi:atypical dual specificity phosphatase
MSSLKLTEYGICFGTKIVLADINLHLLAQGVSVLMGPVGTGKSSLLCSLAGVNDNNPRFKSWGKAYLNGQAINQQHRPVLVRQQLTQLGETVENAILRQAQLSEINLVKRREFVTQLIEEFSADGLLTMLDQRLIDIKPVWQRIALILGSAATKPPLLMIDEPTSNLSAHDSTLILRLISNLGLKQKIIVVLHNQTQARDLADDIILLAGGRIQFYGKADVFFGRIPPNDVVKQFVLSGSVSIAAPDARKEDLADDATLPPPLPQAAIEAAKSFALTDVSPAPVKVAAKKTVHTHDVKAATELALTKVQIENAKKAPIVEAATQIPLKLEQVKQDVSKQKTYALPPKIDKLRVVQAATPQPPMRQLIELPKPSKDGVSIVAEIGKVVVPASRGPKGFSWIVPGMLAGCPMPGVSAPIDYDLDLLVGMGITVLITLTEEDLYQGELKSAGLRNIHLPIYDREAPSLNQMHMLLLRMQKLLEQGDVLAVHCLAGIGRTGTVLAAWMIKEGGLAATEAIRRLRLINPNFVQSEVQEVFLAEFENDILKRMR